MNAENTFKKENGIFYTGELLAEEMISLLDINYQNDFTLIEPAVGEGHILSLIIKKYLEKNKSKSSGEKKSFLENNVFAFDIREEAIVKTIQKLNDISKEEISGKINWNIKVINAIDVKTLSNFYNQFDYVISNPPYVSRKHMDDKTVTFLKKNSNFSNKYNFDLYYYFFELGLRFWNRKGKAVYITPNSYLRARGSQKMVEEFISQRIIEEIIDFEHQLAFEDASTYSAITVFSKDNDRLVIKNKTGSVLLDEKYSDLLNNERYNLLEHEFLLDQIDGFENLGDIAEIKNGIATLQDKVFLIKQTEILESAKEYIRFKKDSQEYKIEKAILRKIVRPSNTEQHDFVIFPYVEDKGQDRVYLPNNKIKEMYPKAYSYLIERLPDSFKDKYGVFLGRTQGFRSYKAGKIVVPKVAELKRSSFKKGGEGFVIAGLSIQLNPNYDRKTVENIREYLNSEAVIDYLESVSKNYASGYKSISSVDLKKIKIPSNLLE